MTITTDGATVATDGKIIISNASTTQSLVTVHPDGRVIIDGRQVHPQEAAPPARELGEAYQPETGAVYYAPSPFTESGTYEYRWDGNEYDRRARDRHLIAETEAEAAAMTARAALHERARRVRADIWARGYRPAANEFIYSPVIGDAGTEPWPTPCGGIISPWHFSTEEGCRRFIAAMGPDLRALLGGEGDV